MRHLCSTCHTRYTNGVRCQDCEKARMELKARDDVDDLVLAVMFYQGKTGRPPTTRELAQMLGLNSASTVLTRVDRAVALGLLRRDPGSPRSIRVPAHD